MAVIEHIRIAQAEEGQTPLILSFVRKLAEYERLSSKVSADEEQLRKSLFGPRPAAEVAIAYFGVKPAGIAGDGHKVSTFAGRAGIYLEDLFVETQFRGKGVGKSLLGPVSYPSDVSIGPDQDGSRSCNCADHWEFPQAPVFSVDQLNAIRPRSDVQAARLAQVEQYGRGIVQQRKDSDWPFGSNQIEVRHVASAQLMPLAEVIMKAESRVLHG